MRFSFSAPKTHQIQHKPRQNRKENITLDYVILVGVGGGGGGGGWWRSGANCGEWMGERGNRGL
jgi:hypothetical protein